MPEPLIGVVIPHFNNGNTLGKVLDGLEPFALPCLVVDDGSSFAEYALAQKASQRPWVEWIRRGSNGGKGAAVTDGLRAGLRKGWTHALQIDADDQHDAADIPRLLAESRRDPSALVLAFPRFPEGAPWGRRFGRQISRFWVWVETWSFAIGDPLCGFRVYPLEATVSIFGHAAMGKRMDFDPEIAVRLVWAGAPVINVPSSVRYAPGNVSHFRMVRDNVLISAMHTRLVWLRLAGLLLKPFRSRGP